MNEIIVKMPKAPKMPKIPAIRRRKCKRCKKPPRLKLPGLETDPNLIMRGITAGLVAEFTGACTLKHDKKEKPVIGAGRGGKYYCENKSHYSYF